VNMVVVFWSLLVWMADTVRRPRLIRNASE